MRIRVLTISLYFVLVVATLFDRAYYLQLESLWGPILAAAGAVGVGLVAARRPSWGEAWLAVAMLLSLGCALFNRGVEPGLPRVVTAGFGFELWLLPLVATCWSVGLTLVVARRGAAETVGSRVYVGAVLAVGVAGVLGLAVVLHDYATVVLGLGPAMVAIALQLRRPLLALALAVAVGVGLALAVDDIALKLAARAAGTWWAGDPFAQMKDDVPRMLWALANTTWSGVGAEAQPRDLVRWSDDSLLAFLAERHGVRAVLACAGALLALTFAALRSAAERPAWRPEARVLPVVALSAALLPTIWLWLAAAGLAPVMGVASPLFFMGGTNAVHGGLLIGLMVGGTAAVRSGEGNTLPPQRLAGVAAVALAAVVGVLMQVAWVASQRDHWAVRYATTCNRGSGQIVENPRLTRIAEQVGRVPVLDRFGLPIVIDLPDGERVAPFGAALRATAAEAEAWRQSEASYPEVTTVTPCGQKVRARDYAELLPVLRGDRTVMDQRAMREPVHSTYDAQLAVAIHTILDRRVQAEGGPPVGLAVVLDGTGAVRAQVTAIKPGAESEPRVAAMLVVGANLAGGLPLPPASTLKALIAELALEEGALPSAVACLARPGEGTSGSALLGPEGHRTELHDFGRSRPHGEVTGVHEAMRASCNLYFGQAALNLGQARLEQRFVELGFTKPDVEDSTYGITRAGIGQGVEATPRQIADAYLRFTGGTPAAGMEYGTGTMPVMPLVKRLSPAATTVREAMQGVMLPGGTGAAAASPLAPAVGKTGTGDWPHPPVDGTVAWFAGVVTIEGKDRVVVVAFPYSDGGTGGSLAAPAFREITEIMVKQAALR